MVAGIGGARIRANLGAQSCGSCCDLGGFCAVFLPVERFVCEPLPNFVGEKERLGNASLQFRHRDVVLPPLLDLDVWRDRTAVIRMQPRTSI